MEGSPKAVVVDIDTLSSSSELSEDDDQSGSIEVCKNSTIDEVIKQSSIASIEMKTLTEMGYEASEFQNFISLQPNRDMYYRLLSMIREKKYPDLIVKIDDTEFHCYSIVLQCYSRLFFDLKNVTCVNLPSERVTPKSFKILHDWMISNTPISVRGNDLLDLYDASIFLKINPLIEQCLDYFNDETIMTDDRAFLTYLEAKKRNFEFSNQFVNKRIRKFFLTLVAYEEFVQLDLVDVCVILNSSSIGVNSELETFMAAIRWLNYDWKAREEHAYKLMECIRFNIVAPWCLTNLQCQDVAEEVRRVVSIGRIRQLINDAIAFTSTWLFYVNDPDGFRKFVDHRGLVLPISRLWIYDKECCYHHKDSCRNMNSFGYKDFLKYLKQLRKKHKDYWHTFESSESGECQCGSSAVGIPDIFRTNLSLLFKFNKKNIEANFEKSNRREQEETNTSPLSMQDDSSHTSMLDYTSVSSVKEDTCVSSIKDDTSPTSIQEDTLSSSIQEYISPSSMQEDKLEFLHKSYTYVSQMSEDDILNQSGTQEPKDINTKYWYQEKRVLKLTSSESYHRKQSVDLQDNDKKRDQRINHQQPKNKKD